MRIPRDRSAAAADQEIEIHAPVGLEHVVHVQPAIPPVHIRFRRCPAGPSPG